MAGVGVVVVGFSRSAAKWLFLTSRDHYKHVPLTDSSYNLEHQLHKGIRRLKSTTMADVYHIRIKKSYASDVIEDLRKMEAVELLEEPPIPDWQKEEVRRRLEELKTDTSKAIH